MSIFSNKKETPIPYVPWEVSMAERVMRDNYSEIKRIRENKGWCETNPGKINRWFRRRSVNAETCLLLLIRIGRREKEKQDNPEFVTP